MSRLIAGHTQVLSRRTKNPPGTCVGQSLQGLGKRKEGMADVFVAERHFVLIGLPQEERDRLSNQSALGVTKVVGDLATEVGVKRDAVDARFFLKLAERRLLGGFAVFEMTLGIVPVATIIQ